MKIFVLREGFVLIGEPQEDKDFLFIKLTRAAVVRRWGTSHGLGELAEKGKLEGTVLDNVADGTRINKAEIKFEIPCNDAAWTTWVI